MRPLTTRSISAIAPALLAAAAIVLAPATASAATRIVTMNDGYAFNPSTIQAARGDTVKWKSNASFQDHDVQAQKPYRLFESPGGPGGIGPGQSYRYVFTSAGSFPYVCLEHSGDQMKGTVVVPVKLTRLAGPPVKFKITVGSVALTSGQPWQRVIQVDLPTTGTSWTTWKSTKSATAKYTPSSNGTYRFRAYLKSTTGSAASNPSPYKSVSR